MRETQKVSFRKSGPGKIDMQRFFTKRQVTVKIPVELSKINR